MVIQHKKTVGLSRLNPGVSLEKIRIPHLY